MFRFRPSVESLETRETPASLASVTDMVIDSYSPSGSSGPGVYKTTDSGITWTLAPDSGSGRITGVAVDPSAATVPAGSVTFIVDGTTVA